MYFFDINNKLTNKIDWMFNLNHLFLLLITVIILLILFFAIPKSEKGIKVTKIILFIVCFAFESGRVLYSLKNHLNSGGTTSNFNWWWNISFQMCGIMSRLMCLTLLLSTFINKNNKMMICLKTVMLGCALTGGVLTFVYPDFLSGDYPLLHFRNFQTWFIHMMLIFVPIFYIKINELRPRFKDIFIVLFGFFYIGSVALTASQISGNNFAFMLECDLLNDIGLHLPYGLHIFLTFIVVFLIPLSIFGIFQIVSKEKLGKMKKPRIISLILLIIMIILTVYFPLIYRSNPVKSWIGLTTLLPFIIYSVFLYLYEHKNHFL